MSSPAAPLEATAVPYWRFDQAPDEVPTYRLWGLFSTLFCCLPLGFVATHYSRKVKKCLDESDLEGAKAASDTARIFNITAMIFGTVAYCYFIYHLIQVTNAMSSESDTTDSTLAQDLASSRE